MLREKKKVVAYLIISCVLLTLSWLCSYYKNAMDKQTKLIEVANNNTLSSFRAKIRNIHGHLQNNLLNEDGTIGGDLSNKTLLYIKSDIEDIPILFRSFIHSKNVEYHMDTWNIEKFTIGLINYFDNNGLINIMDEKERKQLITNFEDLQKIMGELNATEELGTEERLHAIVKYIMEYEHWEKGLKRKIYEVMQL